MIKVLLADDSTLVRGILKDIFHETEDIVVVGESGNGREAVASTAQLRPNLIVLDLLMPVMDGLEAIETIMAENPTPILVLSSTIDEREVDRAFLAIKKGALDVMEKPALASNCSLVDFSTRLIEKVRLLSGIRVIHHPRRKIRTTAPEAVKVAAAGRSILAIGASTGGPKAVMGIVRNLPADFRGSVFIVQHISDGFAAGFAQWLNRESAIKVRLAEDGDVFQPGEALVAPNNHHMVFAGGRIRLLDEPPVNCCRPSIDVFFKSLPDEVCRSMVSILLSGMGKDGAQGLLHIKERGGFTIVQDEESCAVFGMPKAAIGLDAADEVLPLTSIPNAVSRLFPN